MELGLRVEMQISGRSFPVLYYVEPGGLWWTSVLNSALLLQKHRCDTRPEHQDPVNHTAQKKREKERKKERKKEQKKERKKERKEGAREGGWEERGK